VLGHGQPAPASRTGRGRVGWPCRQGRLLSHNLLAEKEVVEVFLFQAAAQLPQAVIQQQEEISSVPA